MKKYSGFILAIFIGIGLAANIHAATSDAAALELAKTVLKAHGGEKFVNTKSIVMRGSVDMNSPSAPQSLPAAFVLVYTGEKYRFDIKSLIVSFSQVSDGEVTNSSMPGISLPPITRVGLAVLPRIEEAGYVVSTLPEKLKKKKGFRLTSPEGYYTDFIIDEKTSLVKSYESSYELNGREISTAVTIDKYRDVEGVMINERFSQRLDFGQFTFYATFKAKDILLNTPTADDVFVLKAKS
jgi:hypothetical protein